MWQASCRRRGASPGRGKRCAFRSRSGFCFSAGVLDLVFSSTLPAAAKTWLILPLGLGSFALFYVVFRFMIKKWNLKTPGREEEEEKLETEPPAEAAPVAEGEDKFAAMARTILQGLGGPENILSVDNCITRLRLEVQDLEKVNDTVIRSAGALGVMRPGKNAVQVIIGTKVQFVADELKKLCGQ